MGNMKSSTCSPVMVKENFIVSYLFLFSGIGSKSKRWQASVQQTFSSRNQGVWSRAPNNVCQQQHIVGWNKGTLKTLPCYLITNNNMCFSVNKSNDVITMSLNDETHACCTCSMLTLNCELHCEIMCGKKNDSVSKASHDGMYLRDYV